MPDMTDRHTILVLERWIAHTFRWLASVAEPESHAFGDDLSHAACGEPWSPLMVAGRDLRRCAKCVEATGG